MKRLTFLFLCCICILWNHSARCEDLLSCKTVVIGRQAMLSDNPRTHFSRSVNDAPADGETLTLNPPRFRWRYHPEGNRGGLFMFIFQISPTPGFDKPVTNVTTPFNFYNSIAPLHGAGPFYWRVGYIEGDNAEGKTPFHSYNKLPPSP